MNGKIVHEFGLWSCTGYFKWGEFWVTYRECDGNNS